MLSNKLENVIFNLTYVAIFPPLLSLSLLQKEEEPTRNDRHKMRAYNEVLEKQESSSSSSSSKVFKNNSKYLILMNISYDNLL